MTEKTDYELLHGDSDDFTELYKRYSEGIRAFMFLYKLVRNPSDLDDILQLVSFSWCGYVSVPASPNIIPSGLSVLGFQRQPYRLP
jgi:hypothetical protein